MAKQRFLGTVDELEAHLIDEHGVSAELIFDLNGATLRKLHDEAHRWGTFSPGRDHFHY